jgi:hypothetical protein
VHFLYSNGYFTKKKTEYRKRFGRGMNKVFHSERANSA